MLVTKIKAEQKYVCFGDICLQNYWWDKKQQFEYANVYVLRVYENEKTFIREKKKESGESEFLKGKNI